MLCETIFERCPPVDRFLPTIGSRGPSGAPLLPKPTPYCDTPLHPLYLGGGVCDKPERTTTLGSSNYFPHIALIVATRVQLHLYQIPWISTIILDKQSYPISLFSPLDGASRESAILHKVTSLTCEISKDVLNELTATRAKVR